MTSHLSPALLAIVAICLSVTAPARAETPVASATFKCKDGKSIEATF